MTRIGISFKESEKELLEHLRTKRSASNYIKDLIEADLHKNNTKDTKSHKNTEEIAEEEEYSW